MKASKKNIAITFGIALLLSGTLFFTFFLKENQHSFSGVNTTPPPENDIAFENKSISKIEYFEQKIEEDNTAYKRDRNHKPISMVKGVVPDTIPNSNKENEKVLLENDSSVTPASQAFNPENMQKSILPKPKKLIPSISNKPQTRVFHEKSLESTKQIEPEETTFKTAKVYPASGSTIVLPTQKPAIQIVKAKVFKDHKIKAGEAVTFRLLQDLTWNDITIPANQFFTGRSSLQNGNRLQIKIEQLVLEGKIIPLSIEVMDYDQLAGIKLGKGFPANKALAETAEEGVETALNFATRGMGNFLVDPLKKMSKQPAIHLQDGYEVYLKFQP
ncbi:conjugative transposon protein TraM [Flexithrix dorotheae]|uniref:conjugative transposon protein TraM n=1 Tax=Flexithrix dorotheae TaxID=70993 RepID=UPI0003641C0C|nr:conjugative transposon protein TraM [Flexithrix dorotheae]